MDPTLAYLPDGRHICQICCEAKTRDELEPVDDEPGKVWDICKTCAESERIIARDQWCHVATPHAEHGICLGWPRADIDA